MPEQRFIIFKEEGLLAAAEDVAREVLTFSFELDDACVGALLDMSVDVSLRSQACRKFGTKLFESPQSFSKEDLQTACSSLFAEALVFKSMKNLDDYYCFSGMSLWFLSTMVAYNMSTTLLATGPLWAALDRGVSHSEKIQSRSLKLYSLGLCQLA